MIVFPDITPDYTVQTEEGASSKLSCHLFNRAAKLHNGVVRLSSAISAQVVFIICTTKTVYKSKFIRLLQQKTLQLKCQPSLKMRFVIIPMIGFYGIAIHFILLAIK